MAAISSIGLQGSHKALARELSASHKNIARRSGNFPKSRPATCHSSSRHVSLINTPGARQLFTQSSVRQLSHTNGRMSTKWTAAAEETNSEPVVAEEESEEESVDPAGEQRLVSDSDIWELDFCSRPIYDERRKKVWELLICSPDRSFQYAEYFPNNKINSVQLRMALERVLEMEGIRTPSKVRFFRAAMTTIISKAASDLPFKAVPSRRTATLYNWLEERHEKVYPKHPGYDANAPPLMTYEAGIPQELADALRGEQWAFVMLPLEQVQEEARVTLKQGGFGEVLAGPTLPGVDLAPDTLVPGVAVFSARALPLAAWTNGLELAALKADPEAGSLLLETGVNTRWRYANYRRTATANKEAKDWEDAKSQAGGLHFLAIQTDPEAPTCSGFWMMREFEANGKI